MRGLWRINPFYWINKKRFSSAKRPAKVQTFDQRLINTRNVNNHYVKIPNTYQSKTASQIEILRKQRSYHIKQEAKKLKKQAKQTTYFDLANLNPTRWSKRTVRIFTTAFFLIMLPIYLYIGLQPNLDLKALSYPTLEISDIKLETPVAPIELIDRRLEAPDTIAGIYIPSEHKRFIIGHSSTVFKNLYRLRAHAEFTYDEVRYRVTEISTIRKADVDMNSILAPTEKDTIIIMTCAGEPLPNQDATHRLVITAERIIEE